MTYEELITKVDTWPKSCETSQTDLTKPRGWCTFDLPKLTREEIFKLFDRKALNAAYVLAVNPEPPKDPKKPEERKPYPYLQVEIDLIYGMHKSFSVRHRSRLGFYQLDCAQKRYRGPSSLQLALGTLNHERINAEKL